MPQIRTAIWYFFEKSNLFHGLLDAVKIGGNALVEVGVVELSVPLPLFGVGQDGQLRVAALHEWQVLKVLADGGIIEGASVVLEL